MGFLDEYVQAVGRENRDQRQLYQHDANDEPGKGDMRLVVKNTFIELVASNASLLGLRRVKTAPEPSCRTQCSVSTALSSERQAIGCFFSPTPWGTAGILLQPCKEPRILPDFEMLPELINAPEDTNASCGNTSVAFESSSQFSSLLEQALKKVHEQNAAAAAAPSDIGDP